jgi:hypothetical protein
MSMLCKKVLNNGVNIEWTVENPFFYVIISM